MRHDEQPYPSRSDRGGLRPHPKSEGRMTAWQRVGFCMFFMNLFLLDSPILNPPILIFVMIGAMIFVFSK